MAKSATNSGFVFKIIESVCWAFGPAVFALNLFSFKVAKSGFYYEPISEWGIALGVLLISFAFVARMWKS